MPSRLPAPSRVPPLAREVALPHTPRLLRVGPRLFLTTLGAFLLLGLPVAGLVSQGVYDGIHRSFAERSLRESRLVGPSRRWCRPCRGTWPSGRT